SLRGVGGTSQADTGLRRADAIRAHGYGACLAHRAAQIRRTVEAAVPVHHGVVPGTARRRLRRCLSSACGALSALSHARTAEIPGRYGDRRGSVRQRCPAGGQGRRTAGGRGHGGLRWGTSPPSSGVSHRLLPARRGASTCLANTLTTTRDWCCRWRFHDACTSTLPPVRRTCTVF